MVISNDMKKQLTNQNPRRYELTATESFSIRKKILFSKFKILRKTGGGVLPPPSPPPTPRLLLYKRGLNYCVLQILYTRKEIIFDFERPSHTGDKNVLSLILQEENRSAV